MIKRWDIFIVIIVMLIFERWWIWSWIIVKAVNNEISNDVDDNTYAIAEGELMVYFVDDSLRDILTTKSILRSFL